MVKEKLGTPVLECTFVRVLKYASRLEVTSAYNFEKSGLVFKKACNSLTFSRYSSAQYDQQLI